VRRRGLSALGVPRTWRVGRRLDGLGVLSLLFTAASLLVGMLTNNPTLSFSFKGRR
jgi:hypothetical protein